jgi:hypothetical protein
MERDSVYAFCAIMFLSAAMYYLSIFFKNRSDLREETT